MPRPNIHVNPGNINLDDLEQTKATQPTVVCSYLAEPLGAVAVMTINRPEARNALGSLEWQLIAAHLATIAVEDRVRVLIIRGNGPAFCTGADVRGLPEQMERPTADVQQRLHVEMQAIRALYELERPVIAQIHGACTSSGLSLALACDLRICAASASLGVAHHRMGLTGEFGMTWLLPRTIGPARATELLMLGDVLPAPRAEALGLVHRVVPDDKLGDEVQSLAARLAAGPRLAQIASKRGLRRAMSCDLAAMLEWEAQAQSILLRSEDAQEGVRSLLDKRKPSFKGR